MLTEILIAAAAALTVILAAWWFFFRHATEPLLHRALLLQDRGPEAGRPHLRDDRSAAVPAAVAGIREDAGVDPESQPAG